MAEQPTVNRQVVGSNPPAGAPIYPEPVSTGLYNICMSNPANMTPTRTIRVDDELWHAVQAKAKSEGITVTSVIVDALLEYITPDLGNNPDL